MGCIKVLVKTGAGEKVFIKYQNDEYYGQWAKVSPDFVADNFKNAVDWIIANYI